MLAAWSAVIGFTLLSPAAAQAVEEGGKSEKPAPRGVEARGAAR
jgi:hypothetical protein